jgi:hypothetical protein
MMKDDWETYDHEEDHCHGFADKKYDSLDDQPESDILQ